MIKKNNQSFSFAKGTIATSKIIKAGQTIYENFKKLLTSGIPPLTLPKCKGVDLVDYKIKGNSVQDGTPTPDTLIEVESVGERTRNLWDEIWEVGTITNQGVNSSSSNSIRSKNYIPVIGGKTYYLNVPQMIRLVMFDTDKKYVLHNYPTKSFTPTVDGYVRFSIGNVGNTDPISTYNNDICISEIEGGYEPYGYKIPVKVSGKNLFNKNDVNLTLHKTNLRTSTIYPDSEVVLQPNTYKLTFFTSNEIDLKNGLKYSILIIKDGVNKEIYLEGGGQSTNGVFTVDTETIVRGVYVFLSSSDNANAQITINNIQLEIGNVATNYEPYTEPTTKNIYLDEPLRKVGDYADYIDFKNSKVVRNIKYKELSENDDWSLYVTVKNHFQVKVGDNYFKSGEQFIMSNYYPITMSFGTYYENVLDYAVLSVDGGRIRFKNKDYSTIDEWKNWLSSLEENLYVIYRLATPTEETIELPNIPTIKGTTILEIDTKIQPSNMEITYYAKGV